MKGEDNKSVCVCMCVLGGNKHNVETIYRSKIEKLKEIKIKYTRERGKKEHFLIQSHDKRFII